MKIFTTHTIFWGCIVFIGTRLEAQPSFGNSFILGDQKIFPDSKKSNVFYYIPFDYKLATDANGKPAFSLIIMRYTGTSSTGDAGVSKYNNLLQFKVTTDVSQQKKLADLKISLKKIYPFAQLQMLPVRKFSSLLVFASSGDINTTDTLNNVKPGLTEATDENAAVNNSYWTERTVTIRLNNADAQLVEGALRNQQSIISFSYAYYSEFSEKGEISSGVSRNLRHDVKNIFDNEIKNAVDTTKHITLVKADAIALSVDVVRWPTLIQKIDINERMPAKYPLFDVYCYDFNQELRSDLFEKIIEIKARSVNGSDIIINYSFKEGRPEIYAKSVRFAYAVRFDKPFYYRVTEIDHNGEKNVSEWQQKTVWSELLDITSPPDKIVRKPVAVPDQ